MSRITTSASCLSATPRATVAPTFPAPPTTVTLRFIVAPDRAGRSVERKKLHHRDTGDTEEQPCHDSTSVSSVSSVVEGRPGTGQKRLHVPDDGVCELRCLQLGGVLHLPSEIVGDLPFADGRLEGLFDERRSLGPAQVVQHHHAGQND